MEENWDSPDEDKSSEGDRPAKGRGRGFAPARTLSPERPVGRPFRPESSGRNGDRMGHWGGHNFVKIDWSVARRQEQRNVDFTNTRSRRRDLYGFGENEEVKNDGNFSDRRDTRERRNEGNRAEELDMMRPKPSTYIPKSPTEDEEEIFGSGITSGVYFDKYDEIEVKISGENPPEPIYNFDEFGVKRILMDLIKRCKYTKPTPIQKYAIPAILDGRDVMACAQTGSGKTAAYLIPIINRLLETPKPQTGMEFAGKPLALVVTPTRELTIQIYSEARKFSRGTTLKIELVYGGTAIGHQVNLITRGCDLLVATPGRLLDIIRRGKVVFTRLKFLVLDEADRMLDLGFLPDVENIMHFIGTECKGKRQTLMFSATFPKEIQILAGKFLRDYLFVAVGIVGGACADVDQKFYEVSRYEKRGKLLDLLTELGHNKCLVFVEHKRSTDFIAALLSERNFQATSIHGGREQREREEALDDFKNGRRKILVATSVAARGLDIKDVAHVINYDLPKSIDEYVHRIGRTGRVGNRGSAISFYDDEQDKTLSTDLVKILKQNNQEVPEFLEAAAEEIAAQPPTDTGPPRLVFGARDVREEDLVQDYDYMGTAQTFEDEHW